MKISKVLFHSLLCASFVLFSGVANANPNNVFSLITYNVAGLWERISGSKPKEDIPQISPRLNNYDLCVFQEDFNYHKALFKDATHRYRSGHMDIRGWGSGLGDGLSRLSRVPFSDYRREKWKNCHGYLPKDGADCLTPKGFSFARYHFNDEVVIDIYNLHADAGPTSADHKTRTKNIKQLIDAIESWSAGHAVIVAGDTNSRYTQKGAVRQLISAGFSDAWVDVDLNGKIPAIGEKGVKGEVVDKILYRPTPAVSLSVDKVDRLVKEFLDKNGKPLSDHAPLEAVFHYAKGKNFSLMSSVGGGGEQFFNDLLLLPKKPEIKSLSLKAGNEIYQMETVYDNDKKIVNGQSFGKPYQLKMQTGEYVKSIEVCESPSKKQPLLSYVLIQTNKEGRLEGGLRTGLCKHFIVPDGWAGVGFWGGKNSKGITQIGLIVHKNDDA